MRAVRLSLAAVALLLALYGTAGLVFGAIPANFGWRQPARGVPIWLVDNGIHVDLVLPANAAGIDWRPLVPASDLADPRYGGYDHLAFGWGDRRFYMETPRWRDVRPWTVLGAAFGSDDTAMHLEYLPAPSDDSTARRILLRPEEYRRLAAFVRGSFAPERRWRAHGYFANDVFYGATGHYDALMTCNAWIGRALRRAGVRVGWWTPFPITVTGWFA